MSLGTKEPPQARALAAHLDATASRVFMSTDTPFLTREQLQAIFTGAFNEHSNKLARMRAMELVDGHAKPDVLAREDRAAGWAYSIVARWGKQASVNEAERSTMIAAGVDGELINEVEQLLAEWRERRNVGPSLSRLKDLVERTGALPSPSNMATAEQAYLRGLGEALLRAADAYGRDVVDIDSLLGEGRPELGDEFQRPRSSAPPSQTLEQGRDQVEVSSGNASLAADRSLAAIDTPTAPLPDEKGGDDVSIADAVAEVLRKRSHSRWTPKTAKQAAMIYNLFARFLNEERGIVRFSQLRQRDIAAFDQFLDILPKTYGKRPSDRTSKISAIRAAGEMLPVQQRGPASGTRNRHITFLRIMLESAEGLGAAEVAKLSFKSFRKPKDKRARDERPVPQASAIAQFFRSPIYLGSAGWDDLTTAGPYVFHRAAYFGPMLAHYHGLRREEFCGLSVDDLVLPANKSPHLLIRPNMFRRLKNLQSQRAVALHPEILRLGFDRYVHAVQALGHGRVFPELYSPSSKSPAGDRFYDEVSRLMRECGFTTHQVRHFFNNSLKQSAVPAEIRADLMGHGGDSETTERYSSVAQAELQLKAIAHLSRPTAHLQPLDIQLIPWVVEGQLPPWSRAARRRVSKHTEI